MPSPTGAVSAAAHRQFDDPHPQFFKQAHCNVLPSAAGLDLGTHSDGDPVGAIPSGGAAHRGPPSLQTVLRHIKKSRGVRRQEGDASSQVTQEERVGVLGGQHRC